MLSGVLYVCAQKQSDKNHKCTTNYGSVTTLSAAFYCNYTVGRI